MEDLKDAYGRKLARITCCACGEQFTGPEIFRYYSAVCDGCKTDAAAQRDPDAKPPGLWSEDALVRAERQQMGIH